MHWHSRTQLSACTSMPSWRLVLRHPVARLWSSASTSTAVSSRCCGVSGPSWRRFDRRGAMRILVTGGAGYVGSACLRQVVACGHEALAYDNLSKGHRSAVADSSLVEADIGDTDALVRVLADFRADAVIHFAAATYVGESVLDPEY